MSPYILATLDIQPVRLVFCGRKCWILFIVGVVACVIGVILSLIEFFLYGIFLWWCCSL